MCVMLSPVTKSHKKLVFIVFFVWFYGATTQFRSYGAETGKAYDHAGINSS
jgi:hypothetical protein